MHEICDACAVHTIVQVFIVFFSQKLFQMHQNLWWVVVALLNGFRILGHKTCVPVQPCFAKSYCCDRSRLQCFSTLLTEVEPYPWCVCRSFSPWVRYGIYSRFIIAEVFPCHCSRALGVENVAERVVLGVEVRKYFLFIVETFSSVFAVELSWFGN